MAVKLGIVAGGGELPARLVEVCRANGREIFVLAFEGQTLQVPEPGLFPFTNFRITSFCPSAVTW